MNLKQLQENFQAYILDQDTVITNSIVTTKEASSILRLDIYKESYVQRLIEILAMSYPTVKKMVTEKMFDHLGQAYIHAYPSNHFSIRIFGRNFSKFLVNHPSLSPQVVEMSKFEWALAVAQDAKDAPNLKLNDLAAIPAEAWPVVKFIPHPSIQQLSLHFNVADIWKAADNQLDLPSAIYENIPLTWLVWRRDYQVMFAPKSVYEIALWDIIKEGNNFSTICEKLCAHINEEEVVPFVASTLQGWTNDGIFSDIVAEEMVETLT